MFRIVRTFYRQWNGKNSQQTLRVAHRDGSTNRTHHQKVQIYVLLFVFLFLSSLHNWSCIRFLFQIDEDVSFGGLTNLDSYLDASFTTLNKHLYDENYERIYQILQEIVLNSLQEVVDKSLLVIHFHLVIVIFIIIIKGACRRISPEKDSKIFWGWHFVYWHFQLKKQLTTIAFDLVINKNNCIIWNVLVNCSYVQNIRKINLILILVPLIWIFLVIIIILNELCRFRQIKVHLTTVIYTKRLKGSSHTWR